MLLHTNLLVIARLVFCCVSTVAHGPRSGTTKVAIDTISRIPNGEQIRRRQLVANYDHRCMQPSVSGPCYVNVRALTSTFECIVWTSFVHCFYICLSMYWCILYFSVLWCIVYFSVSWCIRFYNYVGASFHSPTLWVRFYLLWISTAPFLPSFDDLSKRRPKQLLRIGYTVLIIVYKHVLSRLLLLPIVTTQQSVHIGTAALSSRFHQPTRNL